MKICIIGSTSTGKTTISDRLSKKFECGIVNDFSSYHFHNKKINRPNEDISIDDILVISNGQMSLENKFKEESKNLVICDTDLVYTKSLSLYHLNSYPKILDEYIASNPCDLYFLLNNDVKSIKGNVIVSPRIRQWQFDTIKSELEKLNRQYIVIEGKDYEQRFNDCVNQIEMII